ncbi:MAG: CPBP family intramembrane metalloprotease [Methanomassiliicoccaceae archaeon]|jgi:membrane protease YdiL (CAAX protease family)|nr:CPBP family intramembrane metalloprotease [Methanomassiliicoccaceae archaeon]
MSENERCDRCDECLAIGHAYCAQCGRPTGYVAEESADGPAVRANESGLVYVVKVIGLITLVICTAMLFFEIFTMFWVMSDVITIIGSVGFPIFILMPVYIELFIISGVALEMFYLFLVIAVLVSFFIVLYSSRDGIKDVLRRKFDKLEEMPLFAVATLFAATIAFNIILNMFLIASGNEPGTPGFGNYPPWALQYSLLHASVWEELLCRVLLIGLPVMIIGLMMGEKGAWKRLFGRFEMNNTVLLLIIISSVVFAYAHLGSWDAFKLIPTFVTGLALGYLFVRFGIWAAILLHFLVNYSSSLEWVFDDAGIGPTVLFLLVTVILGVALFAWYVYRSIRFLKEERSWL